MRFTLPVLGLALATPISAQFDDAMWFAARQGRTLTKVDASGKVLAKVDMSANGFDLSRVARAPNGDLWLVNFITATLTLCDRNGVLIKNVSTSSIGGGGATDIVFDKAGVAWVTFNSAGVVARMDAAGNVLGTVTVGPTPLGITIDNQGGIWVGHRVTAPSRITRIDPVTFTPTSYNLPATSKTLGGTVLADSPGLLGTSQIWVCGDGANELHVFDNAGTFKTTYTVGTSLTAGVNSLTLDGKGDIWCVHFRSRSGGGDVYHLDRNTGAVLQVIPDAPEPIAVMTDSFGRVWYHNRITFSGPTPSEARRADTTPSGQFEVSAPTGNGAYSVTDPNGFHRAYVIDPFGDADGDTALNVAEALAGTSPYDAQSNPGCHMLMRGRSTLNSTMTLEFKGNGPRGVVIAFATGAGASLPLPPFSGRFRLDPTKMLPVTVTATMPSNVSLTIPNDPALIGFVLHMQGATTSPPLELTNDTAIVVQ